MIFSILFRIPEDKVTTLFETDDLSEAVFVLRGAVINSATEVIDFSGNLDGYLDHILGGVKLFDTLPVAA
jgi:hypothetical protein